MSQFNFSNFLTRCGGTSGASLIELTMTIPILLLLFLGGMDVAAIVRIHHETSILARTVAEDIFQSCRQSADPSTCIQTNLPAIGQRVNAVSPHSHVIISFYPCASMLQCFDDATPPQNCSSLGTACTCSCPGGLGVPIVFGEQAPRYVSKFNSARVQNDHFDLIDHQGWIAVTEIYSDFAVPNNVVPTENLAYEATIY